MKRVLLEPAYILHRRSYRETSCLAELFTSGYGRLTVIAKGVNKPRSPLQGLLQPFIPLLVSFAGKGELMSLTHVETSGAMVNLKGDCLYAGFYLNELLMTLLQKWDAHQGLYAKYEKTLSALQTGISEKILRSFEKTLLEELGYGILPKTAVSLHNTFSPEEWYRFMPDAGFSRFEQNPDDDSGNIFSGKSLIAVAKEDWNEASLSDAKRLIRLVLAPLLGTKTIHSRRLFMRFEENKNEE